MLGSLTLLDPHPHPISCHATVGGLYVESRHTVGVLFIKLSVTESAGENIYTQLQLTLNPIQRVTSSGVSANSNKKTEERKGGPFHLLCSNTTDLQTRGRCPRLKTFIHLFPGNVIYERKDHSDLPLSVTVAPGHTLCTMALVECKAHRKPVTPNNCHILL